jgi:hypothetical protein
VALTNYAIGGTSANKGVTRTIQLQDSAERVRYDMLAQYMQGATGANGFTQARAGVLTAGSLDNTSQLPVALKVTAAGSALNLNVARGAGLVERNLSLNGTYRVASYATATVTLGTADATNPRWDRIDLQVLDGAVGDNSGTSLTQFIVTPGVASGSPALAAAPANSIPCGFVKLPAGTTTITSGMVFDNRKSAALAGAVRVCLPGDLLTDVGFMVSELRDTTAIGGFSIDRWDTDLETWLPVIDLTGAGARYTKFAAAQTVTTTTSTSYVNLVSGSTLCGHTFVAPPSGIVRIGWGINALGSNPGSSTVFVGVSLSLGGTVGSGTSVAAASNDEAIEDGNGQNTPGYRLRYQTALTPGTTYNVWILWRNSGAATATGFLPFIESAPVAH